MESLFKSVCRIYIGALIFVLPSCIKNESPNPNKGVDSIFNPNLAYGTLSDSEGNVYRSIQIGTQTWMAENLRVSKYRNGDSIPRGLSNKDWESTTKGAFSIYQNNEASNTRYGKLYNWYAVSDSRNLCPVGWHVPTDEEWTTLEIFLENNGFNYDGSVDTDQDRNTNNRIAKAMATVSGWQTDSNFGVIGNSDYPGYQNKSGFSGLPGGIRFNDGNYYSLGYNSAFWSFSDSSTSEGWFRYLNFRDEFSYRNTYNKQNGFSVRCVKD